MTETLRDMMAARADAAPGPNIDIQGVVRSGRRRIWRHRAAGGTTACAAVAAVALVVPTVTTGDGSPSDSDGLGERQISYASGSTIHYGDETIDVSPHTVAAYVLTDDGFVYADLDDTIYLTNGEDTEAIGHAGAFTQLRADDSGSYVAWVEFDDGELPETVVYDTRVGAEVLRTDEDNGPGPGYLRDGKDMPSIDGLDGETVFVRNAEGVVAIDIVTGESRVVIPPPPARGLMGLNLLDDAANGHIMQSNYVTGVVVSSESGADEQRFPDLMGGDLSPGATYVAGSMRKGDQRVVDVATKQDVSPTAPVGTAVVRQWIDDETYVASEWRENGSPIDLLICSIPAETCEIVREDVDQHELRYPDGQNLAGS